VRAVRSASLRKYCQYYIEDATRRRPEAEVFEDWLLHVLLPLAAYAMLAASAYVYRSHARAALFLVAAATLVFLFVGIHNAWDAVTYHVLSDKGEQSEGE